MGTVDAKQLRRKSGCAFSCEGRDQCDVNATELRFNALLMA